MHILQAPLLRNARQCHSPCKFQICSQKCQKAGASFRKSKAPKILWKASVFKHQASKVWGCNLVPAHAIERSFCIHTSNDQSCALCPSFTAGFTACTMPWAELPRAIPGSPLGAEGNIDILALKGDSGKRTLARDFCRLTRSLERIVSQGSR